MIFGGMQTVEPHCAVLVNCEGREAKYVVRGDGSEILEKTNP